MDVIQKHLEYMLARVWNYDVYSWFLIWCSRVGPEQSDVLKGDTKVDLSHILRLKAM